MENPDSETSREIRELRAEVQSLKRTITYIAVGIGVVVVVKSPDYLETIIIVGIILGFLFKKPNFTIFPSRGRDYKPDA